MKEIIESELLSLTNDLFITIHENKCIFFCVKYQYSDVLTSLIELQIPKEQNAHFSFGELIKNDTFVQAAIQSS